jgi:hypothetical protein
MVAQFATSPDKDFFLPLDEKKRAGEDLVMSNIVPGPHRRVETKEEVLPQLFPDRILWYFFLMTGYFLICFEIYAAKTITPAKNPFFPAISRVMLHLNILFTKSPGVFVNHKTFGLKMNTILTNFFHCLLSP